jgi:hypothetical protein
MPEASSNESCATPQKGRGREEEIEEELYALEFSVKTSLRYHQKRRRFFHAWRNSVVIGSFIGAMLTAYSISAQSSYGAIFLSVCVALLNALDLAFGFAKKEDLHATLYRKFSDLLKETIDCDTIEGLNSLQKSKIDIEKDEPPALKVLNIICHNEEALAQGKLDDLYTVRQQHVCLSQLISFDSYKPEK